MDDMYRTAKEIANICFDTLNTPMTRDDTPDMPNAIKPLYLLIKIDIDAEKHKTPHEAYVYGEHFCRARDYELVDYHYPMKYSERHYPYIAL